MSVLGRSIVSLSFVLVAATAVSESIPRGPGEIALLAAREGHEVDVDLRQALIDPEPHARMLAGRVIAVVPHGEMFKELVGALAREQDRAVGAEFVRDVAEKQGVSVAQAVETGLAEKAAEYRQETQDLKLKT